MRIKLRNERQNKLLEDLKAARDEAKLKIHVGSEEAQDEWAELEKRWQRARAS